MSSVYILCFDKCTCFYLWHYIRDGIYLCLHKLDNELLLLPFVYYHLYYSFLHPFQHVCNITHPFQHVCNITENSFKQFREYPENDNKKVKFFASLRVFHNSSNCSISRVINTESNVGFNVLNKLLKSFALEKFPEHWKDYAHPNPNLKDSLELFLRLRNAVAHGGDLTSEEKIDQKVYDRFKKLVMDLMYEIRLKMLCGLKHKTFSKSRRSIATNDE